MNQTHENESHLISHDDSHHLDPQHPLSPPSIPLNTSTTLNFIDPSDEKAISLDPLSPIDASSSQSHQISRPASFPPTRSSPSRQPHNHRQNTEHSIARSAPPIGGLIRKQTWASLLKPDKKLAGTNPTYKQSLNAIIRSSCQFPVFFLVAL